MYRSIVEIALDLIHEYLFISSEDSMSELMLSS